MSMTAMHFQPRPHTLGRVRYVVHPSWWGWNRMYIPCICWCYLGPPHTRRALGPPSTASHTPDWTHVKLGDSWLVNNLGGGSGASLSDGTSGGTEPTRRSDQSGPPQPWEPGFTSVRKCADMLFSGFSVSAAFKPADRFPHRLFHYWELSSTSTSL